MYGGVWIGGYGKTQSGIYQKMKLRSFGIWGKFGGIGEWDSWDRGGKDVMDLRHISKIKLQGVGGTCHMRNKVGERHMSRLLAFILCWVVVSLIK